jgi:arylsulfatase A-like enzyme
LRVGNGDIDWVITNREHLGSDGSGGDAPRPITVQDVQDANGLRWQIEQMHRELKQLVGTEKCQCRVARSQRNHLACCYLAWLSLRMAAQRMGHTLYAARTNLFREFLRAQLRNPTSSLSARCSDTYPYNDELVSLAKHYPNVWVDLCWAWSIDPYSARDFVRRMIHAVPSNKLFAFGGDTWWPNAAVAYAAMARQWLARSLQAEVDENLLTEKQAIALATRWMRSNQEACFDLEARGRPSRRPGSSDRVRKQAKIPCPKPHPTEPPVGASDEPAPPNLVYVFADQLRYGSCGFAGDAQARTPRIDGFAAEGVNFSNAVACTPVCTAYRATLFTGLYTTSHGMVINELRIHPGQRCFGHVLTDAGYRTAYIGKWHLWANELGNHYDAKNSFVPPGPHRLGFDGEWKAYNFHHENYGTYYHADTPDKMFYGEGVYEPEAQTDLAIDFVRRAASDPDDSRPFALVMSWGPPHDPWGPDNVPARFWDAFAGEAFPDPPNYRPENDEPYCDDWSRLRSSDRAQLESWRRGYYAQTASVDACFGRLLDGLHAAGVAEDTLVVFTSDHGEMMGAQGRRAKNIFYDEACRVPLLLRWPAGGVSGGKTCDACLGSVDLLPTLCGLMGLEAPAGVEGMDLSHCAYGRPGPEPEAALLRARGRSPKWEDGHEWRALAR